MMVAGIFLGVVFSFLFSGLLLNGLSFIISKCIKEVRRQFQEISYLKNGKVQPDIITATHLHTIYALKVLTIPGLLMVFLPFVLGYLFGVTLLFGFIIGVFFTGLIQSFSWSNFSSSIYDASRYIRSGYLGGKGSNTYRHADLGNQFSRIFNEVLSPNTNILIKSMSIIIMLIFMFMT